jgi:hypothetical protein
MGILDFLRGPRPTVRRSAHIYRRGDRYFVTTSSQTRDGFGLEEGPVEIVAAGDGDALANAVRAALGRSRSGIPTPKDWSSRPNRVVEAAGLKRFNAFAKGAALVTIDDQDASGRLRILPSRNGGPKEGFVGLEDQAMEVGDPDLASAIETAFGRCA